MRGRHTGAPLPPRTRPMGRAGAGPRPERPEREESRRRARALAGKIAFWTAMAATVALAVYMVVGVVSLMHSLDHPEEGGWDGWQCAAASGPCDP